MLRRTICALAALARAATARGGGAESTHASPSGRLRRLPAAAATAGSRAPHRRAPALAARARGAHDGELVAHVSVHLHSGTLRYKPFRYTYKLTVLN
eukprot:COSAG03_NODE_2545_length_2658_cov_22.187964_2_plen_97_part_00